MKVNRKLTGVILGLIVGAFIAAPASAGMDGSGKEAGSQITLGMDGSGTLGMDGSGTEGMDGSGTKGMDGSGTKGMDGSGTQRLLKWIRLTILGATL